ncbi:hypothetical protein CONLIGDRAFT_573874 [Coniochaeta ligniaria NRRL 30616]|uniref:Uncharacterized protein n=1 Tax=Coniochaeta ligniaria NRRL 30616 TaxID=1408157 RepID=A0A1J7IWA9_9PEZI|nr:hypothetical protein CONLIGDRAFT_573874 [Coniochaeta ligniaria NRRL 30616]
METPSEAASDTAHYFFGPQQPHLTATGSLSNLAVTPSDQSLDQWSPSSAIFRPDEFSQHLDYQSTREELRCLILNTAQSAAATRQATPVESNPRGSESQDAVKILAAPGRLKYLQNYIDQVAPWLDMFDSDRAFGIQVPSLAKSSPALLCAILALSARQMERKEGRRNSFTSLELYQEAIRRLAPLLHSRDMQVIPICVILCCLEMMSASAQDWRRHLEGCAALFHTFGVHGFTKDLLQAVFWCYARMVTDVCAALISDGAKSTLLPPCQWLPLGPESDLQQARQLFRSTEHPDMHANYAVYLCARVCELISKRTRFVELGEPNGCTAQEFEAAWLALWEELQAWLADRPADFLPVSTVDTKPFPGILFSRWSAISSTQLFHTACVLMLDMMPRQIKGRLSLGVNGSRLWHAKRICGISATNPHHGCLNNAIQPLWVAGKLLSHQSEHEALVELIWSIETSTGWGTCWRIADLEAVWGYKVRRNGASVGAEWAIPA